MYTPVETIGPEECSRPKFRFLYSNTQISFYLFKELSAFFTELLSIGKELVVEKGLLVAIFN